MIQAAVLDYVRVLDNMRTLVAADVAPRGCWVITVPSQSDRGVPARMVLAGLWLQATFNTETLRPTRSLRSAPRRHAFHGGRGGSCRCCRRSASPAAGPCQPRHPLPWQEVMPREGELTVEGEPLSRG